MGRPRGTAPNWKGPIVVARNKAVKPERVEDGQPEEVAPSDLLLGRTFAERKAARTKAVQVAENKSVRSEA